MAEPRCVDCIAAGIKTVRPTPFGGPRSPLCHSCWQARRKKKSANSHGRHTTKQFGMSPDEYQGLYEFQKAEVSAAGGTGVDPIDQKSTGASKRLAIDHDHVTGEIRGLLSGRSNYQLLGMFDRDALVRAIEYLDDPPARRFFGGPRYIPVEE